MKKIIQMNAISKQFVGVQALSDVSFDLCLGEIHALLGENGAGKSTLINILTGVFQANSGEIIYAGEAIRPNSPLHAQRLGISTVYQEINLLPELSIAENIFLGHQPQKWGFLNWRKMIEEAEQVLERFAIDVNVQERLGRYSIAIQQIIAIARALVLDSKVLILDEPTSSLNDEETHKLFEQLLRLKEDAYGIIFVTHFLDQVFEVSDRATILRDGTHVGTYQTRDLTKENLVSLLLGKELHVLNQFFEKKQDDQKRGSAKVLLQLRDIESEKGIKAATINLMENEVMGCVGLLGSGRTEFANILFGIDPASKGTLVIGSEELRIKSPYDAVKRRIGLSPEDRKTQGIIGELSIRENIILALQSLYAWKKLISRPEQEQIAEKYVALLKIKTPSIEQAVKNLSGGNQQKVIIARWLVAQPRLLILDEPTRGIDIGAKTEIQELIVNLKKENVTVLFISTEIEEIDRCSSRVMVMHNKRITRILEASDLNENKIFQAILAMDEQS